MAKLEKGEVTEPTLIAQLDAEFKKTGKTEVVMSGLVCKIVGGKYI